MKRIIVAGIHTEVGKTVVAAVLTKALGACYWKPVQCGTPTDSEWVKNVTGQHCYPSGFFLKTPCSPHLAAKNEGVRIHIQNLQPPEHTGCLVIEGTGGILAPLNESDTWADAAALWQASWILVHRHYLGSLNHFLLTIEALKQREIPLLGIVFNGKADAATEEMLLQKAKSRCLGRLVWEKQLTKSRIEEIAHAWKPLLYSALGV